MRSNKEAGRKGKNLLENPEFRNKIINELYKKNEWRFSEIHQLLLDLGIIWNRENRMATSRIIKRLVQLGVLEKKGRKYITRTSVTPRPFSPSLYAYELEKQQNQRLSIQDSHIMIAGFEQDYVMNKLTGQEIELLNKLVPLAYKYIRNLTVEFRQLFLEKGVFDRRKREFLTVLSFLSSAYMFIRNNHNQKNIAIVITPRPEEVNKLEAIRNIIVEVKGPYHMAYEIAKIINEKEDYIVDLVLRTPFVKSKIGEKGVEIVKFTINVFRLAHKINGIINILTKRYGGIIDKEIQEIRRKGADNFIEIIRQYGLKEVGKALGVLGFKGCEWFKEIIRRLNFVEVPKEKFEELEHGFKEGKQIYYALVKELGSDPERYEFYKSLEKLGVKTLIDQEIDKENYKYIEIGLLRAKIANLTPLETIVYHKFHTYIDVIRNLDFIRKTAKRMGFAKEWVDDLIKYCIYEHIAELLSDVLTLYEQGDFLKEYRYNKAINSLEELRKYSWMDIVKGLALATFWFYNDENATLVIEKILPKLYPDMSIGNAWKIYKQTKKEIDKAHREAFRKTDLLDIKDEIKILKMVGL